MFQMRFFHFILFGSLFVLAALALLTASRVVQDQNNPWRVPEKYQKMKNPIPSDKSSISVGRSLYMQHCKSCHGKAGLGDGPKSAQLETACGDLTSKSFQEQSDGAIFFKTKEGRDDMPGFAKKIPDDDDIWSIINFLRTLK